MLNPLTEQVTEAFLKAARTQSDVVASRDHAAVKAMFDEVRSFFGDFTDRALEQSSYMIDRLVERL